MKQLRIFNRSILCPPSKAVPEQAKREKVQNFNESKHRWSDEEACGSTDRDCKINVNRNQRIKCYELTEKICQSENNFALKSNQRVLPHDHQATNAAEKFLCALEMLVSLNDHIWVNAVLQAVAFDCLFDAVAHFSKLVEQFLFVREASLQALVRTDRLRFGHLIRVEEGNASAVFHRQVESALGETQVLRVEIVVRQVRLAVEAALSLRNESFGAELFGCDDFVWKSFEFVSLGGVADWPGNVHRFVGAMHVNCQCRRKTNEAVGHVTIEKIAQLDKVYNLESFIKFKYFTTSLMHSRTEFL